MLTRHIPKLTEYNQSDVDTCALYSPIRNAYCLHDFTGVPANGLRNFDGFLSSGLGFGKSVHLRASGYLKLVDEAVHGFNAFERGHSLLGAPLPDVSVSVPLQIFFVVSGDSTDFFQGQRMSHGRTPSLDKLSWVPLAAQRTDLRAGRTEPGGSGFSCGRWTVYHLPHRHVKHGEA